MKTQCFVFLFGMTNLQIIVSAMQVQEIAGPWKSASCVLNSWLWRELRAMESRTLGGCTFCVRLFFWLRKFLVIVYRCMGPALFEQIKPSKNVQTKPNFELGMRISIWEIDWNGK